MNIEIQFQTQYLYAETVSFSVHLYRLFPRAGRDVLVRSAQFQTNADAAVSYRRDMFDNEIASCAYPEKSALLAARLHLELTLGERNAFAFLLAAHAMDLPFQYTPEEAAFLGPYLNQFRGSASPHVLNYTKGPSALPFWKAPTTPRPTVETLVELTHAFREHLRYERREEGVARMPEETLSHGSGACRDFAVLLAASLRGLGVAARLVSGYLIESGEIDRVAEGALHAWTEAYLPGAGWVGLDPTNGIFCDHHHIAAAVGLTPEDISPTRGKYYHSHGVPSQMTSTLQIHERS
jgi:transglutaminase-like putative cysteine protease